MNYAVASNRLRNYVGSGVRSVSERLRISPALHFMRPTAERMPMIWPFLLQENSRTCDLSYGCFLMWAEIFDYEYAIYKNTLFVKGKMEGDMTKIAFAIPVGALSLEESVKVLKDYCDSHGIPLRFSAVPEKYIEPLKELGARNVTELDGWGDYIYDAQMLATVKGRKMAKKRNHVNQFVNAYGENCFEPLDAANISDALAYLYKLEDAAAESTEEAVERMLSRKLFEVFKNYDTPMFGGLLRVDGKVVAVTLGDLKDDTLFVHIEKGDRDIVSSYEMINKSFASYILSLYPEVKYINREDDSGDEGLRKAKLSYCPVEILRKFDVSF